MTEILEIIKCHKLIIEDSMNLIIFENENSLLISLYHILDHELLSVPTRSILDFRISSAFI